MGLLFTFRILNSKSVIMKYQLNHENPCSITPRKRVIKYV